MNALNIMQAATGLGERQQRLDQKKQSDILLQYNMKRQQSQDAIQQSQLQNQADEEAAQQELSQMFAQADLNDPEAM
jgi:hypothetical protein